MPRSFRELVDQVQEIVTTRKEVDFGKLCYELGVSARFMAEAVEVAQKVHKHKIQTTNGRGEEIEEEFPDIMIGDWLASDVDGKPRSEWVLYEEDWYYNKQAQADEAWAKVNDESVRFGTRLPNKAEYFNGFKRARISLSGILYLPDSSFTALICPPLIHFQSA